MTADLVAFLRARLDEDEQAARAAQDDVGEALWVGSQESGHPWRYQDQGVWGEYDGLCSEAPRVADTGSRPVQDHIARHDPARVLAEVDAKRRLLEEFSHYHVGDGGYPEYRTAVRFAALPYAGHPDYREE